jgi:hypothetical protein
VAPGVWYQRLKKTKAAICHRGFGGIFELFFIALVTGSDSAPPPRMETKSG